MRFDRYKRSEDASWAFWQFNEYETQINSMYWSGMAALSYSMYAIRKADPSTNAKEALNAEGPDAGRFPADLRKYLTQAEHYRDWSRSSFVMAATGALENYVQRIVLTALMSDPALVYGKSKRIDGVAWLKIGIKADHSKVLEGVTKGEWGQRYAAIKKLFGEISDLEAAVSTLDKIRVFRNGVGHAFGRELVDEPNLTTRKTEAIRFIKERVFKDWLRVISESAKAIDLILVRNHVGDFEPMMHFHEYQMALGEAGKVRSRPFVAEYKKALARAEGHSKGHEYCEGLIAAYDAA